MNIWILVTIILLGVGMAWGTTQLLIKSRGTKLEEESLEGMLDRQW